MVSPEIPPESGKKELRSQMLAQLRFHLPEREARSQNVRANIESLDEWKVARSVAVFAALPTEPDLNPLLRGALASGRRVALPRIVGNDLEWVEIQSERDCMPASGFSQLLEPTGMRRVPGSELDLVLVPGLAFGRDGERLGRGGGFYDRALAVLHADVVKIGVCFRFQICANIPVEAHDQRVRRVVTD
jgi:5-formyltetrahydrofolate cyclo-ligase